MCFEGHSLRITDYAFSLPTTWRSIKTNPVDTTLDKSTAGRVAQQPPFYFGSLTNGLLCRLHKGCVIVQTGAVPATNRCCWWQSGISGSDRDKKKVLQHRRQLIMLPHHPTNKQPYFNCSPHPDTQTYSALDWHAHDQITWQGKSAYACCLSNIISSNKQKWHRNSICQHGP